MIPREKLATDKKSWGEDDNSLVVINKYTASLAHISSINREPNYIPEETKLL